ncbi:hypothetical protein ACH5RR_041108 [Cinchona calisaya]|uniref:BURP domain-containing protein n=1 Tax=Cinchona calisaya TaxID=153742 RepID=A0ABD2XUK0_9GENT
MELLKLLLFCMFFSPAVAASHVDLDIYWKTKLPNTPMPKAVRDLLHNEWLEDKSTSVAVGKGGVNVNTGKGKSGSSGTHVSVGHSKGVGVRAGKPQTSVGVGKGGVHVYTFHKGHPVYVGVTPSPNPFIYQYAATKTQLHDSPNVALFFLQKDLHRGTSMNLQFVKSANTASFLPRKIADSIPFSSNYVPEIFNQFYVKPESLEAEIITKAIKECEEPGIKGEEKYCATSLESMVDFSTSKLGKNVQAVSTEAEKDIKAQKYGIVDVKKLNDNAKAVACHKQNYAYAVFYCHTTQTTDAYMVSLVGADGKKAKVVAVCHKDTAGWNPKHLAFQVLKVKPGTVPVCHFLPEDHVVWVSK